MNEGVSRRTGSRLQPPRTWVVRGIAAAASSAARWADARSSRVARRVLWVCCCLWSPARRRRRNLLDINSCCSSLPFVPAAVSGLMHLSIVSDLLLARRASLGSGVCREEFHGSPILYLVLTRKESPRMSETGARCRRLLMVFSRRSVVFASSSPFLISLTSSAHF